MHTWPRFVRVWGSDRGGGGPEAPRSPVRGSSGSPLTPRGLEFRRGSVPRAGSGPSQHRLPQRKRAPVAPIFACKPQPCARSSSGQKVRTVLGADFRPLLGDPPLDLLRTPKRVEPKIRVPTCGLCCCSISAQVLVGPSMLRYGNPENGACRTKTSMSTCFVRCLGESSLPGLKFRGVGRFGNPRPKSLQNGIS